MKFNEEKIDEGDNFNTGDGIFVVPVSGIYLFSWTMQTYSGKYVDTELRVQNLVKGTQHTSLSSSAGNFATTRNVLCSASKGDHVWIQTSKHYSENTLVVANGARCSFMGILIHDIN